MKRTIFFSAALVFLLTYHNAHAQVIWQEDFDSFSKDWVCCLSDCALVPGLPPGYTEFHSNTMDGNYGECNTQITTDAHLGTTEANKRGYRIYLEGNDPFPTGENVLKKNLGANYTQIYLRWYERDSYRNFTNFQKLFRLKQTSGQILIPEWQVNYSHVNMNLWSTTTGNLFWTNYNLDTDYTPNTWVCYELKIDLVNKQAEFWVDGVSKGSKSIPGWGTGWYIRYIEVGGNQFGHSWSAPTEHYRDYDNIVVSTSYVGPSSLGPTPPTGLRIHKIE